jgi:DNA-binding winged helix-turn-helix (wHTH) protein/TolB-like protein
MANPAHEPLVYRFDDITVDPRAHQVVRAGEAVSLEPKAYAVLLVLLREAGAVVPRDALLDEVWGHRHVTPAVLNRVIALLRRALGDDADHPRLIRTVYGTGYGFIGSVRREAAPGPAQSAPTTPTNIDPPDGAADATPPATGSAPTKDATPASAARRGNRVRIAAFAAVAIAALGFAIGARRDADPQTPPASPTVTAPRAAAPPPSAAAPLRIAVIPLRAAPGDDALAAIANGLTDGLIETLARQPRMAVLARESSERVGDDPPATAIPALAVDLLVAGRVLPGADDRVTIEIELHRSGGALPWIGRYERPRTQVFRVLGPLLDDLSRVDLPIATEAGTKALQDAQERVQDLYWRAQAEFAPPGVGTMAERARRALAALHELHTIAPEFALGHALESSVHTRLGITGAVALDEAAAAATAAAERAIRFDPDLAEGHLARGFAATMQWRSIEALGPARRALELAPNDYRALSLMGVVLAYAGRLEESAAYSQRAETLNPLTLWVAARNNWAMVLGGRDTDALAVLDALERQAGQPLNTGSAPRIHIAFGSPARALHSAGPRQPGEVVMQGYARAAALQLLDEPALAKAELDALAPLLPAMPMYADLRLREALVSGDAAAFADRLRGTPSLAMAPWRDVFLATALAHAGDERGALRLFGEVFADPHQRELLAYSWFPTHSGVSTIADWVALRRAQGVQHAPELAAYEALVDGFQRGGVKVPMLTYHRAVGAALRDDADAADRLLGAALAAGWLDPVALRFDLAWRAHAESDWLARRRAEVADRVQQQRREAGFADR